MSDSKEIMALDHARRRAMIEGDVAKLGGLFADDMMWIHANARADSKQAFLDSIATGKSRYLAIDCSEETVRFYGETAVVSGIMDIKVQIAGEDRALQNRFTIVWAHLAGGWKVVNWQSTTVRTV